MLRKLALLALALGAWPTLALPQATYTDGALNILTPNRKTTATLGALNAAATVKLEGRPGAGFFLTTSNLSATVVPELSLDEGTTWRTTDFMAPDGSAVASIVFSGGATTEQRAIVLLAGTTHVRARVSAYTSGTSTVTVRATTAGSFTLRAPAAAAGGTSSSFGAAFPASGTAAGFSDGTNMQGGRVFDLDSGAGTQYGLGVSLRKIASGGSVEAGTSSDPLRVDPTGSTTQPVSGTVTTTPPANASTNVAQFGGTNVSTGTGASGAGIPRVTVANDSNVLATQSGTWTVQQGTPPWSVAGPAADGAAVSGNPVRIAGKDGSGNTQDIATNASGNLITFVTSLVAEVTATGGWKAEDAGHTTGDTGMLMLGVRNNAGGSLCNADLDYCPPQFDTNGNLRVAVTGASGGTSSVDNSAWTFGTSTLTPAGAVVDDVATNAVTENSVGAPRMSGQRILYVQPSSGTAPATPFDLDLDAGAGTANRQSIGLAAAVGGGPSPLQASAGTSSAGDEIGLVVRNYSTDTSLSSVAWTSATASNTVLTAQVHPFATVAYTLTRTGAVTSGTLNFECSVDNQATWFPWWMTIQNATTMTVAETFTMTTPVDTTFVTGAGPCTHLRARLNPTIAGAGTITLQTITDSAPIPYWVGVGNAVQLATGTNTIGALTANQSVNLAQVAGATTVVGSGNATGALRVELANNGTGTLTSVGSITTAVTPGTAAANLGKAEDAGHTTGDVGVALLGVRVDPTTTATSSANTDYTAVAVDHVGAVATGVHPGRFSCFIALTATATTQCQAAPAAGLRAYVTSMQCSNGAATVQGVDIVFGTGAACVTGITALTHKYQMGTNALTTSPFEVSAYYGANTPLVPTAANAICVRPTAATAFGCTLTGFIAP